MSVIRFTIFLSLNIFCILLFLYIISCIIFIHFIFICSGACFVTFSLLHVYLQRKTTLSVCTCSWILMTFSTVCMVYFYNLIIACVFLCILTCMATCTFNKFCYFLSTHQTNVNKFPNSFYFISYLLQLSSVNVYIDWKNQMYTHYYSYYNLPHLYIKKIRIYIVPVNPKLRRGITKWDKCRNFLILRYIHILILAFDIFNLNK